MTVKIYRGLHGTKHDLGNAHPESPDRLFAIDDQLLASGLDMVCEHADAKPIAEAHLQLAHDPNYIKSVFERAAQAPGWLKELRGEHIPETEEYGISSFVFRSQKPFHPDRLWTYLNEAYPSGIIRAKGLFWLASRPDDALNFSQAGGSTRMEKAGVWWASMSFNERISYQVFVDNKDFIESKWSKQWGDRMNELVFIGQDVDKEKMTVDLEKCLLQSNEQYLFENKMAFNDPFPINM